MRFALNLPNFGEFADVRVLAEVAAAAEAGGWDGFFIWDHLAPEFVPGAPLPPTADVTVALTAIALATERVRFGPTITPLPRRRVQKVAREFASLDQLSGGRVVLGVGIGWPPEGEFEAFGEDGSERSRAARLDVSLDVLQQCWTGADIDYDGDHLHVHTRALLPVPVQRPRIPVWVAATWPGRSGPLRRAARWDGIYPMVPNPMDDFITIDDVRAIRAAVGRHDDAFSIVVNPGPAGDPAAFAAEGVAWWMEGAFTRDLALQRAKEGPPRVG
jgi:alkanesulfonate monooxygenase SsuD/methylene tetrahydromethanopterin reductase-like flavin-dependent oxidoreductase (luciferase family)